MHRRIFGPGVELLPERGGEDMPCETIIRFRQDDDKQVIVTVEDEAGRELYSGRCEWWDGVSGCLLRGCVKSVAQMFCECERPPA